MYEVQRVLEEYSQDLPRSLNIKITGDGDSFKVVHSFFNLAMMDDHHVRFGYTYTDEDTSKQVWVPALSYVSKEAEFEYSFIKLLKLVTEDENRLKEVVDFQDDMELLSISSY